MYKQNKKKKIKNKTLVLLNLESGAVLSYWNAKHVQWVIE
jgi:hypothetical protein